MIDRTALLADLRPELKATEQDLRARAEGGAPAFAAQLRAEHEAARAAGRTDLAWPAFRDREVTQAAVAWLLALVFVRFLEDNALLEGASVDGVASPAPWLAGPTGRGEGPDSSLGGGHNRLALAVEHQTSFFGDHPSFNDRDWLEHAIGVLAEVPLGRDLVGRAHNPLWRAPLSPERARGLLDFWRRTDQAGRLVHDFRDPDLDTRFLGDLYQDLSESAKKNYALLQTPEFVERFILDHTLDPALAEFGVDGLRLIDPACGSGHFLLGGFARLDAAWRAKAPGLDPSVRVQRALDQVHGIDLNPFAVAIARFRLGLAALTAAGWSGNLVTAPALRLHLAVGDSLLRLAGRQGELELAGDAGEYAYPAEDLAEHPEIGRPGTYHVVVGNPPYITPKDPAAREAYKKLFPTCYMKYALSVPFCELMFRLARPEAQGQAPGYVGQITANSFMKREFGKRLIEDFLFGTAAATPVALTHVIDTSGAYIPGHGTPTVILFGRPAYHRPGTVRAVLGVRGEPDQPADPARGLVWTEITDHLDRPGFDGTYVSVADLPSDRLAHFPWSLSGGGAKELMVSIAHATKCELGSVAEHIGIMSVTGQDDFYVVGSGHAAERLGVAHKELVVGDAVRDFGVTETLQAMWPYDESLGVLPLDGTGGLLPWLKAYKSAIDRRKRFGTPMVERGLTWWEWQELYREKLRVPLSIAFAFVATHNHFVLDRGGKVFKQSAPVIKLPAPAVGPDGRPDPAAVRASEDLHLGLLGVLNSSVACFWLKQVCYPKGGDPVGDQGARVSASGWDDRYEFTGTKLEQFPLPDPLPAERGRMLDSLAQQLGAVTPRAVLAGLAGDEPVAPALDRAHAEWDRLRARMIFQQEELDWACYRLYGLTPAGADLTYQGQLDELALGQRAFEIQLARRLATGREQTAWFERHGSTPLTEPPAAWPRDYRELVNRRLALIDEDRNLGLLERPENKRRWATPGWDHLETQAVTAAILDRLEDPRLWTGPDGQPRALSVAQLAQRVGGEDRLAQLAARLTGTPRPDPVTVIGHLTDTEAVPYLAAWRYKPSGLEKYREWQRVWELQRQEDRIDAGQAPGPKPRIPKPPTYTNGDFRKTTYWKARGKLDVPKERFIAYPGVHKPGDQTPVLGWAGWDHGRRATALAALIEEAESHGDAPTAIVPLLAGLAELLPWLAQWHATIDPAFGTSLADDIGALLRAELRRHGLGEPDLDQWRPPAAHRGRQQKGTAR